MNHLEFAASESAALVPTAWETWISQAERVVGHNLDGDQRVDGYSYDGAYDAFKAGRTAAQYVRTVQGYCKGCGATFTGPVGLRSHQSRKFLTLACQTPTGTKEN